MLLCWSFLSLVFVEVEYNVNLHVVYLMENLMLTNKCMSGVRGGSVFVYKSKLTKVALFIFFFLMHLMFSVSKRF